ncbi:hypothetical protein AAZX31_16G036600 [Glycine max]
MHHLPTPLCTFMSSSLPLTPPPSTKTPNHKGFKQSCSLQDLISSPLLPWASQRSEKLKRTVWYAKKPDMNMRNDIVYSNLNMRNEKSMRKDPRTTCKKSRSKIVSYSVISTRNQIEILAKTSPTFSISRLI